MAPSRPRRNATAAYPGPRKDWEGMQTATKGDTIGLLLDLDAESLTVYVNGVRQGVLVQPGVTEDVFAFSCLPLRWAVELQFASVRIDGPLPPPA